MDLLTVKDLSFTYPNAEKPSLEQISFTLRRGGFYLLCGYTGCGKTTLLRLLKPELAPHGERTGEIRYAEDFGETPSPHEIGLVTQDPNEQIITDRVWHELAFNLENMGLSQNEIRVKTGETATYFGLAEKFNAPTSALSGGEKQLLSLAGAVVTNPKLLLLDEPTSQLDPITAANFLDTLGRLNRDLGITVLLAEHRLEEVFSLADTVLAMDSGRLIACDAPRRVCEALTGSRLFRGFPSGARLWKALGEKEDCPVNVREGKAMIQKRLGETVLPFSLPAEEEIRSAPVITAKGLWFRYEKEQPDILKDISLTVHAGEIFSILGANGVGKTTLLHLLAGLRRPYHGKIRLFDKELSAYKRGSLYKNALALLPQDPKTVFLKDTVRADFEDILHTQGVKKEAAAEKAAAAAEQFGLTPLLDRNPYDLSGGERQKCALVKLLLTEPQLLLLDEPTKGLDAYAKESLAQLLRRLRNTGKTILLVTHDVEFAAMLSDTCALLFDGALIASGPPHAFFRENTFYTTAAARMARRQIPGVIFVEEAAAAMAQTEGGGA